LIDYPDLPDKDLHSLYCAGDAAAGNELVLRYRRLVKICSRPYFLAGGDSEDLLQEGMVGLISAMRDFDPAGGASFRTYAELCIRRRIISAARSASRQKHSPLNDGVSLEDLLFDEERRDYLYQSASYVPSAEDQVLAQSFENDFLRSCSGFLSDFEARILKDFLEGFSYAEIARNFGRSEKSVDNAVQRIRKKLARHLLNPGDISQEG